ncbi:trimeric intracellular cation channel family protein [Campylobacter sp. 19-13652]|uniref:trimeric intracellular cation channel family protein n=1 Tax=Campylobacter sp. 19-13652 TaxID=2840180 RepID=UPI001C7651A7|nr:TRIC cation channel family protein [Campylobacter sp. 19-13652]BCX80050.1 membrane protein [Campylobacter sp. 19-13652]
MDVWVLVDFLGTAAFALSGFYAGARGKFDWLGVFVATFLTALGGGIVRDTIADRAPFAFTNTMPGIIVVCVLVIAISLKLHKRDSLEQRFLFVLSDTLGLASFTITGALVAIEAGFNFCGVVMLGFTTAIGGGVLRDILMNEVPWLLRTGLYGTIAIVISALLYALKQLGLDGAPYIWGLFAFGVAFRLLAYYRSWHLPVMD